MPFLLQVCQRRGDRRPKGVADGSKKRHPGASIECRPYPPKAGIGRRTVACVPRAGPRHFGNESLPPGRSVGSNQEHCPELDVLRALL